MGFFSGGIGKVLSGGILKGGGGGDGESVSATTANTSNVTVNPTTNVTVDTEELAKATSQSGFYQAQAITESATIEATLNAQTELRKSTQAKELKLAELDQEHEQQSKKNYQYLFLVVIAGGLYLMKGADSK